MPLTEDTEKKHSFVALKRWLVESQAQVNAALPMMIDGRDALIGQEVSVDKIASTVRRANRDDVYQASEGLVVDAMCSWYDSAHDRIEELRLVAEEAEEAAEEEAQQALHMMSARTSKVKAGFSDRIPSAFDQSTLREVATAA